MITKPDGTIVRLRDQKKPEGALLFCVCVTQSIWDRATREKEGRTAIPYNEWQQLLLIFRAYIANNYQAEGMIVPDEIGPLWDRCKPIIDKEAAE